MLNLKTLLNTIERHPLFIYDKIRLVQEEKEKHIEVKIRERCGSLGLCSGCKKPAPGYDRLEERRFQFVPLWGIAVYFFGYWTYQIS